MIDLSRRKVDLLDRSIRIIGPILFEPPRRIGRSQHTCHNSTNAAAHRSFRSLRESRLPWKADRLHEFAADRPGLIS
ncbi:hypothetical protein [Bradyrhizobium tropiciagri]|uniref:hypothetical protein n=1 Tax=Bradyrhizobium tropiciagri TaxID=312253 RepID=UPI00067D7F8C|nr:hypothetical protein [Bradyrhizobium tropiciagri]